MSHWCVTKSAMTDQASIEAALKRMGIEVLGRDEEVSLYGQKTKAEIILGRENGHATVGLARQKDGTFAIVGDFYHVSGGQNSKLRSFYSRDRQFQETLQTSYCIESARAKVEEAGFQIEENLEGQVGEDGLITMVAVSYS